MNLSDGIRKRIRELVGDDKSLTSFCLSCNITPSTVFDFMYGKSSYPKILTIKRICNGANITLDEFFNTPYFKNDKSIY